MKYDSYDILYNVSESIVLCTLENFGRRVFAILVLIQVSSLISFYLSLIKFLLMRIGNNLLVNLSIALDALMST